MRQIDRFQLIDKIGRVLQSRMTYTDIDVYLQGFEVPTLEGEHSFNSKWVYAKERLAGAADAVIVEIANELEIPHVHVVRPGRDVEESRFWQPGHLRLFLTHLSTFKGKTTALQKSLRVYGISSFVAHVDIRPTKKWEQEIENALFSMDALAAILMPGFKASDWTDQEVGVAVGRGVPVIPIMKGLTPYGFIAKYQGFDAEGKSIGEVSRALFEILIGNDQTSNRMWTAFVDTLVLSRSPTDVSAKLEILGTLSEVPKAYLLRLRDGADEGGVIRASDKLRGGLNRMLVRFGVEEVSSRESFGFGQPPNDLPF